MLLKNALEYLDLLSKFQRAPTLGGECYDHVKAGDEDHIEYVFQRAPTLGGECYTVNSIGLRTQSTDWFQQAPTLGGECYDVH